MENNFFSLKIDYKFSSHTGRKESNDFITEYIAMFYAGDHVDNSLNEYAGEIVFKIINLDQVEAEGLDVYDVFDTYEYTFRHGQNFYDFEKGSLKEQVINTFPDLEFLCNKICIISTIGIIPKFRGKGLGAKVFKDLVWQFNYCELFILQPYPLQFEHSNDNKDHIQKLDLHTFEKNMTKATLKLSRYYKSWGFKKISGIKDLLFYSPICINEAFDNIGLDD